MPRAKATTKRAPQTTADDGVVWSKRQRARLYGSLRPRPGDPQVPAVADAWAAVRNIYGVPTLYDLPDEADRTTEKELAVVRAELAAATPPATLTPRREQMRVHLLMNEGEGSDGHWDRRVRRVAESLVPLWVGVGGLAFASQVVWSASTSMGLVTCGDARRAYVARRAGSTYPLGQTDLYWLHLRRSVLAAEPAEYEAARKVWRDAGVSPYILAATFCREPGEVDRLVARELARKSPGYGSVVLFAGVTDPALALRFAGAQPLNYACGAEEHAFALVDNLGSAAAPVLIALLERVSSGGDARRALAAAAALADSEACVAALPRLAGPTKTALATALK